MSILLSCRELTKTFTARTLFSGITLGLFEGERTGLIGPNGSGKSTLLRILCGLEHADAGEVTTRRGLRLGYVAQQEDLSSDQTVEQSLIGALDNPHLDDSHKHTRAAITLDTVGFVDPDQSVSTLSGGWRKRLAIARQLIREPDLLLLDEPTNHLDLEGIWWLESLLSDAKFACLLVSHDRAFLENVTNRVIELNNAYPDGFLQVNGAYHDFVEKREEFLAAQASRETAVASRVRREIEWLSRKAKARTTKAQGRIDQAQRLMDELADLKARNAAGGAAGIDFSSTDRRARKLLSTVAIAKSLGGRALFSEVSLTLGAGTKLGLLGLNGSGKTTLLRVLCGELPPDAGEIKRADGLRVVVFDQQREQLNPRMTLRAALAPAGEDTVVYRDRAMHVTSWARRFLFRTEQLDTYVEDLSGGEQARLLIARLMPRPADVLMLDEPTNDLDIPTLDILEESLLEFPGALVLVSHDRYLLDRLCTELLALDGRGGTKSYASLAHWERDRQRDMEEAAARDAAGRKAAKATAPGTQRQPAKTKLTWAEQREWDGIEPAIHAAEARVLALQASMNDPQLLKDHVRLRDACAALETQQGEVNRLYARWAELDAKRQPADGR